MSLRYSMPGTEIKYKEIATYNKLSKFNDYIAVIKYSNKNFWEEELLVLRKKFDDIIPYRIEYFVCEREVLESFRKMANILNDNNY